MAEEKPGFYGEGIFSNWHCRFPFERLAASDKKYPFLSEPRIEELLKRVKIEGAEVLELGCLEGMHSLILQERGAGRVTAIEGRRENFLKCLTIKNAFNLKRCRFLYGDLNKVLPVLSGRFDLCLALGVLYHLRDPVSLVYRIAGLSDKLFVWTHYCTEDYPGARTTEIDYRGKSYRGKRVREDTGDYLSGLEGESFWMYEQDLLRLVKDAGFGKLDLIGKQEHEHGPAMTFLAEK